MRKVKFVGAPGCPERVKLNIRIGARCDEKLQPIVDKKGAPVKPAFTGYLPYVREKEYTRSDELAARMVAVGHFEYVDEKKEAPKKPDKAKPALVSKDKKRGA